jgi:hypothetical protein
MRFFTGGIRPHYYCLPILKRETRSRGAARGRHQRQSALSFSAPTARRTNAPPRRMPAAAPACSQRTRPSNCTLRPSTASDGSISWKALPATSAQTSMACRVTGSDYLGQGAWVPPESYEFGNGALVPYRGGEPIAWRLAPYDPNSAHHFRHALSRLPARGDRRRDRRLQFANRCAVGNRRGLLEMRSDGTLARGETFRYHVKPVSRAPIWKPASMAVTGIDPHHPLRPAITEEDALQRIFKEVRNAIRGRLHARGAGGTQRLFRFEFLERRGGAHADQAQSLSPVLEFRYRDLGGVAFGQTVLMRATWRRDWSGIPPRRTRRPTMRNAPPISFALCAINSRTCSMPAAALGIHGTAGNRAPSADRSGPGTGCGGRRRRRA